jgi:hypothetical protein
MPGSKKSRGAGGSFSFRVSDVVEVPLRGTKLRLRLLEGSPSMKDLGVGSTLVLQTPSGEERRAQIVAHASSSGFARQDRLERTRELDVIVTDDGAAPGVRIPAEIGWTATGPA